MKKKRSIIMLATAFFAFNLFTGCQNQNEQQEQQQIVTDFYDMVNSQWLEENKEYPGFCYGSIEEQQAKVIKEVDDYLIELLGKYSSQPESLTETEEKAVILYEQTADIEKRNELGIKPMEKMLAQVEEVADLEDLIALYKDERISCFNTLFRFEVAKNPSDGSYQVGVCPKTICGQYGMLTEEQFTSYEFFIKQIMMLAGYEEDRAAEIAEHAVFIERNVLESNYYQLYLDEGSRYGEKEMSYLLSNLPLMEIAKEQGYLENRTTLTAASEQLKWLQELFVEENVDVLKDYLLAAMVVKSAPYLNEEMAQCYQTAINSLMGLSKEEENSYQGCETVIMSMEDFLAEYYMETYVGEEMEQEVKNLAEEIRGEFKTKISKADWMSEETRDYAIKKLESMQLIVGLPEKMHDYSKLTIHSYAEGGNLLDNVLNAQMMDCEFQKEFLQEECQEAYYFHPLEVNATYARGYNAFAIHAAIITYDDCSQDSKYEEKLAILGFIIAHEISHGFDGSGSQFNAEGIWQNWWTIEDKTAYRERINEVKHYFDGMEVSDNVTLVGEQIMDEAYADLSSMSVCMDLLGKRNDSDYKLFFETYAKSYREATTSEYLAYLVGYDSHLPRKFRVNQIVNQMDEFYEVYEVPEDGEMYVPEEERLQVWE
ncbi:MAG: M13 family metallopeptidase [Lachnospiraceae bacterium]|nr:M13 family metallopeptidase [Lachnospiraceae bacterium]